MTSESDDTPGEPTEDITVESDDVETQEAVEEDLSDADSDEDSDDESKKGGPNVYHSRG